MLEQLVEDGGGRSTVGDGRTSVRGIRLLTVKELLELRPPEWLIDEVIEEGAFAVLYGPSGEGKTFVALDWALSIAANRKWQGRDVAPGAVIYVVAEGGRNVGSRIAAWMQEHRVDDLQNMFAVLQAVAITDANEFAQLQNALRTDTSAPV